MEDKELKFESLDDMLDFLAADEQEAIDGYDLVLGQVEDEHVKEELTKLKTEEQAHKDFLEKLKEDPTAVYVDPFADEEGKDEESVDEVLTEGAAQPVKATKWTIQYYDGNTKETVDFDSAYAEAEDMVDIKNIFAEDGDYPYWTEEEGLFDICDDGVVRSEFSESADAKEFPTDQLLKEYWWEDSDPKNHVDDDDDYEKYLDDLQDKAELEAERLREPKDDESWDDLEWPEPTTDVEESK